MRFAMRYLVQEWWFELFLPRIGLGRITRRTRVRRFQLIARNFHGLALNLGGLMIKVGQFLSTRLDVLPPEITRELEGLQDEVPPVPFADIRALAEAELGMPLDQAFAAFDPNPIAAASLGQAHPARLRASEATDTGFTDAVVKVQRPGIEAIVAVDLAALRRIAGYLSRVRMLSSHADFPALIEEFAHTSLQEVDYLQEAANAERFTDDFAQQPGVTGPEVAWERTTRRVLTLSDVTAIKITDVDALRAAGIDPHAVASALARSTFDQLFDHGFFHADPHPGNIFVTPRMPPGSDIASDASIDHASAASALASAPSTDFAITYIDFGMMGTIPDSLRSGLRKLVVAVATRDGKRLIASIQDLGILLPSADNAGLEKAMTELFARFGGMGIAELQRVDPRELADFGDRFGEVIRSMPIQLPENFLLIIRTASLVSGVCSSLDPDFNMWEALDPYAQTLLRDEGTNLLKTAGTQAVSFVTAAARMPQRVNELVELVEGGRLSVQTPQADAAVRALERTARRLIGAVIFAGLLVAGVMLLGFAPTFGIILMCASVVPLLYALLAGRAARFGPPPRR